MKKLGAYEISDELETTLSEYVARLAAFRDAGPLDPVATAKLEEHFKASHIFHSAGIEGNRLTLQETVVVLKDGIDVSGLPLRDTLEVKNLGNAFEFLKTIANAKQTLRESDIRDLHRLIVGPDSDADPGQYRRSGVIISGAEHRPPEPIEVPSLMEELVSWINDSDQINALLLSAIAHHRLAAIHPFLDGNGRVSRLLMNLLLMRGGVPIANISREDRPKYYEALSFADIGLMDLLVDLVYKRSSELFSEYERIRAESRRMEEWAARWGQREAATTLRRAQREYELWQSRVRQIFLEFQRAADVLNETLEDVDVSFYDYNNAVTLDRYLSFLDNGRMELTNAFSLTFANSVSGQRERFVMRYFRDWDCYPRNSKAIPLSLFLFDKSTNQYDEIAATAIKDVVRLRDMHFRDDGTFVVRSWNPARARIDTDDNHTIQNCATSFFDDVLRHVMAL